MSGIALDHKYYDQLMNLLEEKGLDRQKVLENTAFEKKSPLHSKESAGISASDLDKILNFASKSLNVSIYHIAFEFGMRTSVTTHGSLGLALMCCDSIRSAIELYSNYISLASPAFRMSFYEKGGHLVLEKAQNFVISKSVHNFIIVFGVCSALFEGHVLDTGIFQEKEKIVLEISKDDAVDPAILELLKPYFSYVLNTSISRALVPLSIVDLKITTGNEMTKATVLKVCDKEIESLQISFVEHVANLVYETGYNVRMDIIADQLHMSSRTLQRNLASYGKTFSGLVEGLKMEHAKVLLSDSDKSIKQIAFELEYSEPTNFSASFKKSIGDTPNEFRQKNSEN